jgi:hypothetical protein
MPEMQAVAAAAPLLAGEALRRADATLAGKKPPVPIDADESRAAFLQLMKGVWQPPQADA